MKYFLGLVLPCAYLHAPRKRTVLNWYELAFISCQSIKNNLILPTNHLLKYIQYSFFYNVINVDQLARYSFKIFQKQCGIRTIEKISSINVQHGVWLQGLWDDSSSINVQHGVWLSGLWDDCPCRLCHLCLCPFQPLVVSSRGGFEALHSKAGCRSCMLCTPYPCNTIHSARSHCTRHPSC